MSNVFLSKVNQMKPNTNKEWDAEKYHQNSSIQLEASKKILSEISFRGDESILDIGCGDGKITAMISGYIPKGKALGIDLSPEMLLFANKKFRSSKHKNIFFKLLDATKIRFEKEFDIIFSSFALHWVANFSLFIKGVHKALKDNGKIAFTIPLGISAPLQQATEEAIQNPAWAGFFTDYIDIWKTLSASQYEKALLESGFRLVSCEVISHKKIFDSRESFEDYVIQWYPYVNYVAEELKEEFFRIVIDRYLEIEPCNFSGTVNFEFPRVDIIATKS